MDHPYYHRCFGHNYCFGHTCAPGSSSVFFRYTSIHINKLGVEKVEWREREREREIGNWWGRMDLPCSYLAGCLVLYPAVVVFLGLHLIRSPETRVL